MNKKLKTLRLGQTSFLLLGILVFPNKKSAPIIEALFIFFNYQKSYDLTNFPFLSLGMLDFTMDFVCKSSNIFKASST
jgi:hypothetical protein